LRRDEKPDVVKAEIHPEPEETGIQAGESSLDKSDIVDTTHLDSPRLARQSRVTFNIPEPVQYLEQDRVREKRLAQPKPDTFLDEDISDLDGGKTSDSEVEAVDQAASTKERKRYRPFTARVRVTSPLPDPVNYLSRQESQRSSICDTSQAEEDLIPLAAEVEPELPVAKTSDSISYVTFKEPYKIPDPVCYLTRQEKLNRLKEIASTGSVDSDTKVFNEIMRAVQASAASIDSDDVYEEIMKAFKAPNRSFDSYDIYNEIMSALRSDEREDALRLAKVDSVDIAAPEILSFHNFTQSSTYSSTKTPSNDGAEQIVNGDVIDIKEESPLKSAESPTTNESIDIPENPVSSPVHYPSSKLNFDEAYTPIMVDGKIRKASAKSLSKLRQHCSSRAHPCDCNDVRKNIILPTGQNFK
jgi:hypothetical protein